MYWGGLLWFARCASFFVLIPLISWSKLYLLTTNLLIIWCKLQICITCLIFCSNIIVSPPLLSMEKMLTPQFWKSVKSITQAKILQKQGEATSQNDWSQSSKQRSKIYKHSMTCSSDLYLHYPFPISLYSPSVFLHTISKLICQ